MVNPFRRTHPAYEVLSRLADGELSATDAMSVNAHLAECQECREEVDFMVDLRRRLRALTGPPPPPEVLPEILSARGTGERGPLEAPDVPSRRPLRVGLRAAFSAAAILALVAVGLAVFGTGSAEAGSSSLELESIVPGRPFQAAFTTSGPLAAVEEARVVAEIWGRFDPQRAQFPERRDTWLERAGPGRFEGSLELPSTASFARFEVRGPDGTLDPAGRRSFLARRSDGQPTYDALANMLEVQIAVGEEPDSVALGRLTELYGDNPYAWWQRLRVERHLGQLKDGVLLRHVDRLVRFGARASSLPLHHLSGLVAYARALHAQVERGAPAAAAVERVRAAALTELRRASPSDPEVVGADAEAIVVRFGDAYEAMAEALEELWARHGHGTEEMFSIALQAAVLTGDGRRVVDWAQRWLTADPDAVRDIISILDESGLDPTPPVLDLLRDLVRRYAGTAPLLSRASYREAESFRAARGRVLDLLGELLRRSGRSEAAYDTLRLAAETGWETEREVRLAALARELGRIDAEARHRARILADPTFEAGREEQWSALEATGRSSEEARALVADARASLAREAFTEDAIRPSDPIRLRDPRGRALTLDRAIEGPATILQFWEPEYDVTAARVDSLIERCAALARLGIAVRFVSKLAPDPGRPVRADACGTPWLHDEDLGLRRAYDAPLLGQALVVDGDGLLYYRGLGVDEAVLRARLLAEAR